jgi:hypothetical protein
MLSIKGTLGRPRNAFISYSSKAFIFCRPVKVFKKLFICPSPASSFASVAFLAISKNINKN